MPSIAVGDNCRLSLRLRAEEKALLLRAATLDHTDLKDFVTPHALSAAKVVVEEADHVQLSERDSLRVLDQLESPAAPNARLLAAARALPKRPIVRAWHQEPINSKIWSGSVRPRRGSSE